MVASEVYRKLDHMLHYMFPNNCYNEMLIKLNVFDPDCSSLVLSRLLGLAVTAGSLMLFVPQIIKIQVARSGAGISLPSQLLGLLSCFATAAYSYASNFVFSQWGDSLFVAIQMAIIIMQILYFSTFSAYAFAFLAFCWAVTFAVIGNYIPFAVLAALQAVTIPLVVVSKFLQIHANFHDGSTGQLSLISVGLQFGGCIARVFTSVKETGDALVIGTLLGMGRISALTRRFSLRFLEYWKNIGSDYKAVCIDIISDSKKKPLKSAAIGAALAALAYAYKTNPNERDMLNTLTERRQAMVLLPNSIHNAESDRALTSRTLYLNQHRLEHIDCYFFSLALRRPHDKHVQVYHSQDPNLRNSWWRDLWGSIVDVGAFGRWYYLNRSFENYDINEDEFIEHTNDSTS